MIINTYANTLNYKFVGLGDLLTFLLSFTSVKIEWTRHVLENIEPNAKEKPAISSQARAVQIYGNASTLVSVESRPRKMTLLYVSMQPMMIRLFRYGLDILMYLHHMKNISDQFQVLIIARYTYIYPLFWTSQTNSWNLERKPCHVS